MKAVEVISDGHYPLVDDDAPPSSMLHVVDFVFKIVLCQVNLLHDLNFARQVFFVVVTQYSHSLLFIKDEDLVAVFWIRL